jgi:class 3 adenylate cyclase
VPDCVACGQQNPDGARFCLSCGRPLTASAPAVREERRVVTVIFVDMVEFTSRAERLDPEDVRAILRPYHDRVKAEIESFGGVVEKFIGDAVMGVFGAPTAYGDDPERAVRAALSVRTAVAEMNQRDASLALRLRIGVNTGEAVVTMGARPELGEAMVTGDVVNTAARLQQSAPVDAIVAGAETYICTRDVIRYERGEDIAAKGKSAPLAAWKAVDVGTTTPDADGEALVGRAGELDVLRGVWQRVAETATPNLVTVIAPPGLGKSRLATEFVREVRDSGARVVRGRSFPYRESSAYGAFTLHVKQLAGIFESDSVEVARAKLVTTVERIGAVDGDTVAQHLCILLGLEVEETIADRESLFFSVRCFIEAVAADQPVVLVFEDLHWADSSLLDLVELLSSRLRDIRVMLLALSRPELLDQRPGWGGGLPAFTALPLQPLDDAEARALVERRLAPANGAAGAEIAQRLVDLAEGNPLFIEQLAAVTAERASSIPGELPTTIRGIITARLDALPAPERAVLLDAAVVGKVFWLGALQRVSEEPDRLPDLLGALERRDLVHRETVSAFEGDRQFAFKHVMIRDVAYDMLTRVQRRERHAEMARFIEDATSEVGEAASQLARHWIEAGEPARAVAPLMAAAEHAGRGWAKQRAVDLYQEALSLAEDDDTKREIRRRLGVVYQASFHAMDVQLQRGADQADATSG